MEIHILLLVCVAFVSVSGQFIETEYKLESVPLPIRPRINSAQYEIQPNVGREIEFSTEAARISNQGRRHIDRNRNTQNGQINRQVDEFELHGDAYQTNDRPYETRPVNRQINSERQQKHSENQFNAPLYTNIQHINRNNGNLNQNHRHEETNLRTNLNNPRNNHQSNSDNQENQRINEDRPPTYEPQDNTNTKNLDTTFRNQDNQPNYEPSVNEQTNQNPNHQQPQKSNTHNINENVNNRHAEASLRAIDSNSYSLQNVDSANNNRNYNNKPSRQNTEITREHDNKKYEKSRETTEPTKIITVDDKSVTEGTKSTEDNELASKSHPEGRMGNNDDDKWIWSSSGGKTTKTTIVPTIPTVDDRAAFSGDKCPTGQCLRPSPRLEAAAPDRKTKAFQNEDKAESCVRFLKQCRNIGK